MFSLIGSVFFFSSRRRHTRFDCDWSSDVCSSDLWTLRSVAVFSAGLAQLGLEHEAALGHVGLAGLEAFEHLCGLAVAAAHAHGLGAETALHGHEIGRAHV